MMRDKVRIAIAAPLLFVGGFAAHGAEVKADFIKGTYVIEGRCEKLVKINAGGPKNVETVPETLTSGGFASWEGGCSFKWIKQKKKGQVWVARMACRGSRGARGDRHVQTQQ